jgi:integrase
VLTDEEINYLLDAGDDLDRAIMVILLGSGMRIGELARLKPSDISGDEVLVTIRRAAGERRLPALTGLRLTLAAALFMALLLPQPRQRGD